MLVPANLALRLFYSLAIILAIAPLLLIGSAWGSLLSRGLSGGGPGALLFLTALWPLAGAAVGVLRIYTVFRHRGTLDAYVTGALGQLRRLAIWAIVIGTIVSLAIIVGGVVLVNVLKGENAGLVTFIAASIYEFHFSNLGLAGCLLFELSRLLGFEVRMREDRRRASAAVARAR